MKVWTLAIAAAAVAVAGSASPALAQKVEKRVERVSFDGLDLNTIAGQEELKSRVRVAVRRVCNYSRGLTDTRHRHDAHECLANARENARQQVAAVIEDQRRGG